MKRISTSIVMSFLSMAILSAKVELPSILSDNMVLQQQTDVALWGTATPGNTVIVSPSWTKKRFKVTADSRTGEWKMRVPTPMAGGPFDMVFSDGEKTVLSNILIGEVWYCSGQSNMFMRMSGYPSSPVEGAVDAALSAKASTPIRIFEPAEKMSRTPLPEVEGKWEENTPDVVIRSSALAWFFANRIQSTLDVPVGVIVSSSGGSSIQCWMDRRTIAEKFSEDYDLAVLEREETKLGVHMPCVLYNGMVDALVPYTFKGMLWYQGCTNRGESPELYTRLQTSYVEMMRDRFQNPDASFYFVQLSSFFCDGDPDGFMNGYFLEAQQKTLESIPNSGMVTTTDLGMYGNIHPVDKKTPAERLAYLALQNDYGVLPFCATAPVWKSIKINDAPRRIETEDVKVKSITVYFNTYTKGMADSVGPRGEDLKGFEIAGDDRVFHKAHAMATWGAYVNVWSDEVPEPVAVRYCFRNWAPGNLKSNFGIPVAPSRTDAWDDLER